MIQRKLLVKKLWKWKQNIQEAGENCKRRYYPSDIKLKLFLVVCSILKQYELKFYY